MEIQLLTISSQLSHVLKTGFQCIKHKAPAHIICLDTDCSNVKHFMLCKSCVKDHPKSHLVLPCSQVFSRELLEEIQSSFAFEKEKHEKSVHSKLSLLKDTDLRIEKIKFELNELQQKLKMKSRLLVLENKKS